MSKIVAMPLGAVVEEKASSEFWDAFGVGGGIVVECACGRHVFAANSGLDFDEGELEQYLKLAETEPDRWLSDFENDSIGELEVDGQVYAYGCKCGKAARYEQFIIDYQRQILRFIDARITNDKRRLDDDIYGLARVHHAALTKWLDAETATAVANRMAGLTAAGVKL